MRLFLFLLRDLLVDGLVWLQLKTQLDDEMLFTRSCVTSARAGCGGVCGATRQLGQSEILSADSAAAAPYPHQPQTSPCSPASLLVLLVLSWFCPGSVLVLLVLSWFLSWFCPGFCPGSVLGSVLVYPFLAIAVSGRCGLGFVFRTISPDLP